MSVRFLPSLLFTAAAFALGGRAEARAPAVEVEVLGVEDLTMRKGALRFNLSADVHRTRGLPLHLRALKYSLVVNKTPITRQDVDLGGLRIRRGETERVLIPCSLELADAAGLTLQSLTSGSLKVKLKGEASVRVLIFPYSIPFQTKVVDLSL